MERSIENTASTWSLKGAARLGLAPYRFGHAQRGGPGTDRRPLQRHFVYVLKLSRYARIAPPRHFDEVINVMKSMVCDTIAAFVTLDTDLAAEVAARDDTVDQLLEEIIRKLGENMKQWPDEVDPSICYLLINKYLERMADHAVNVAEWIPYIAGGEYII
jgi:phosphate transport system protein